MYPPGMTPLTFRLKSPVEQFLEHVEAHQRDYGTLPASVQVSLEDMATFRKDARVLLGFGQGTLMLYGVLLVPTP